MIGVVTDSACDLTAETTEKHRIAIVPLSIRFGEEVLLDGVELTKAAFWDRMRSGEALPETSAPSAGQFVEVFERLASDGMEGIVCVNLSSRLSATYQSATVAAGQLPGIPVRVIDSRNATTGIGLQVLEAARAAAQGADLDQVVEAVQSAAKRTTVFAALDTLEFLRRGGRIGAAAAFFGTALQIKPMIQLSDGAVVPTGRVRTRSKAIAAVLRRITDAGSELREVAVIHADVRDDAERIASQLDLACPVSIAEIGPVIGTHTGPGTIGAAYRVR